MRTMPYDASIRANSSATNFGQQFFLVVAGIKIALTAETKSGSTVKGHETPADPIEITPFPSFRPEFVGIKAV